MPKLIALLIAFLTLGAAPAFALQTTNPSCDYGTDVATVSNQDVRIVPTFHSMGVYWNTAKGNVHAHFREVGSTESPRRSLDLPYASADGEHRGSLLHLTSGTKYEIILSRNGVDQAPITAATWCEQLPVAETRFIDSPTTISGVHGSPDGYILYTADPNGSNVINGGTNSVVINNSSYVIVRGLVLKGAASNGVILKGTTNNIVIENNIIEGWGGVHAPSGFGVHDFGVGTDESGHGTNFGNLIIQRNVFRNPRHDTNNWTEYRSDGWRCEPGKQCHPTGPGPIFLLQTAGHHVIRYNEIYQTNGNYFNDGIGGNQNKSFIGAPHRDSDIYGNSIQHVWDDAIESEGANMNVRIWGNYINKAHVAHAVTQTSRGPLYIWRNVSYDMQFSPAHTNQSGLWLKAQGVEPYIDGHMFIYNNSTYRRDGIGGVGQAARASSAQWQVVHSENNIMDARKPDAGERLGGILGSVTYGDDPLRPFALAEGTLGHDEGVVIPNITDGSVGQPDMGAQEFAGVPLLYGVEAYLTQAPAPLPVPEPDPEPVPSPTAEIIIDNLDATTTQTGTWNTSGGANAWDGNSVHSDGGTFTWPIPELEGRVEVYVWWTHARTRTTKAVYRIFNDGRKDTDTVNQRDEGLAGQWQLRGTYNFTNGGRVELSGENGQVSADAVRLVLLDAVPPSPDPAPDPEPIPDPPDPEPEPTPEPEPEPVDPLLEAVQELIDAGVLTLDANGNVIYSGAIILQP